MTMIARKRVPELMDDPSLDYRSHAQALRGLARLNAASFSHDSIWSEIEHEARRASQPLRILDLATGGGDIPIALYHKAKRLGLKVEIVGSDISADAISYAKNRALQRQADVEFIAMNVFEDDLPPDFDIVMTSLFTHHLDPDDVVMLLAKMSRAARLKVLVNDLVRSEISYCSVWLATRLLSRSAVVHYDGPVSVNASFTAPEFLEMASRADISSATIKSFPPCRQMLVWQRESARSERQVVNDMRATGREP